MSKELFIHADRRGIFWNKERVTNTNLYGSGSAQFYPTNNPDFVNTIGTIEDLNIGQTSIQQQNNSYTIGTGSNSVFLLDGRIPSGPKNGIVIGSRVTAVDTSGAVLFKNSELVDYIYTTDSYDLPNFLSCPLFF